MKVFKFRILFLFDVANFISFQRHDCRREVTVHKQKANHCH